ncbi:MAG: ADOP family duplicated permease [Vicinamibacteraceae bacterium]
MSWLRRLVNTIRSGRLQREIDHELSFHIVERAEQLRAEGLTATEAIRHARQQFGQQLLQAERTRDVDIAGWLDALFRNVRYAVRTLARTPVFTATVVLTLALGIGANSAVFSALDAVLLRPLPFPDADRLMRVNQTQEQSSETGIAPVRLEDWNRLNTTFEAITGYYTEDVSEISGDLPERVKRAKVAPRFLEVWGVAPALGRGFTAAEHRVGGPSAVLISDRYWRVRLGADAHVLNRAVRIGSESFPIIGVMPPSFLFPDRDVDLWFPVQRSNRMATIRYATWYDGIGRLKPNVTFQQGRDNLAAVQAQLAEQYPDPDATIGVNVAPLKATMVRGVRSSLWLLFGAVSVLLLIACTNIAALLLSRAAHRRQEISVRLALGASRATVAAQLLTETAVLAFAGGTFGLVVAAGASAALRSVAADLPRTEEITLDGRILLYTLASTVTVALLSGLLPAIRTARETVTGTLGEAGRTQIATRSSLPWVLVGAQVALSVTLLAAAGLLVRSFQELARVDPGFEPSRVLTFRVSASWSETGDYHRLVQRIDRTIEALQALPGVDAVATSTKLPGVREQFEATFELVEARGDTTERMAAEARFVSPGYFTTMQIPVLEGELCRRWRLNAEGDTFVTRDVMVSRTFAAQYLSGWPSVVGLHLAEIDSTSPPSRIVGVVGDARERGLNRAPGPTVYGCSSAANPMLDFLVRTRGEPLALAQAVRLKIKELDPLRSVYDIAPLEERIGDAYTEDRLRTVLLVLFAVTALSLACIGLYGTLSYVVSLRRREVGLRLALGALRRDIIQQFVMQGLRVVGPACLCGLALSFAFTRALSGMLFGVSTFDPVTLAGVIGVVLAVATLAALVPATRAALVEPMVVLREE